MRAWPPHNCAVLCQLLRGTEIAVCSGAQYLPRLLLETKPSLPRASITAWAQAEGTAAGQRSGAIVFFADVSKSQVSN